MNGSGFVCVRLERELEQVRARGYHLPMHALLSMLLTNLLLIIAGYLAGSLPFSVWLTRMRGRDVRAVGDGNPGAVNAFKAAGPVVGVVALLLDFLKGALPVAAACWLVGLRGWWLTPVILAPVLGHMLPLFARFRGGKALAVTFGVWTGVTLWEAPCVLGATLMLGKVLLRSKQNACIVLLGMSVLVLYVVARYRSLPLSLAALLCALLVSWRHRRELVDG